MSYVRIIQENMFFVSLVDLVWSEIQLLSTKTEAEAETEFSVLDAHNQNRRTKSACVSPSA